MNKVPLRRSGETPKQKPFHFVSGYVFDVTKRGNYLGPTLAIIVMMHSKSLFLGPRQ